MIFYEHLLRQYLHVEFYDFENAVYLLESILYALNINIMLKDTQTQFSLSRCWVKCIKVMSNASEMLNQSPIKKFDTLQNGIVYMHFGSSCRCCIVLMLSNIFRCKCSDTKRNKSYEYEKNDNKINIYNLLNASFMLYFVIL